MIQFIFEWMIAFLIAWMWVRVEDSIESRKRIKLRNENE